MLEYLCVCFARWPLNDSWNLELDKCDSLGLCWRQLVHVHVIRWVLVDSEQRTACHASTNAIPFALGFVELTSILCQACKESFSRLCRMHWEYQV